MEAMQVQEVGLYLPCRQKTENVGKNSLMGQAEKLTPSERDKQESEVDQVEHVAAKLRLVAIENTAGRAPVDPVLLDAL
jgi:hypothetical protein